jgi:hypothetical protein
MLTETKVLALLQVVLPSDTPLTVFAEAKILEILGVVSRPESVKVLQLAASMVPPETPATFKSLVQLLAGLLKINPESTAANHTTLSTLLSNLESTPDVALTYGTFLPICESLLKASEQKRVRKDS